MHPTAIQTDTDFNTEAIRVFGHQFENNPIYRSFCDLLYVHPSDVDCITQIPFLPIQFFKSHRVLTGNPEISAVFTSSGTGGQPSQHFVSHLEDYERSFRTNFENNYGSASNYVVLGLLPSYLERQHSSLVYMVDKLIQASGHPQSGFYLNEHELLFETLKKLESKNRKTLLIGVSFGLLDFTDNYKIKLKNTLVMETGGMKGRRKELIREELHQTLARGFNQKEIHSEYGMTELLSQAYSRGNKRFECPPWMQVSCRDTSDPLSNGKKSGGLNIIDLANVYSCSFIATQDLGKIYSNGQFEVLGRFDTSDIRGCNLMVL